MKIVHPICTGLAFAVLLALIPALFFALRYDSSVIIIGLSVSVPIALLCFAALSGCAMVFARPPAGSFAVDSVWVIRFTAATTLTFIPLVLPVVEWIRRYDAGLMQKEFAFSFMPTWLRVCTSLLVAGCALQWYSGRRGGK